MVTTASGLQYKILAAGDKKAPPSHATDKVTVDYRGKLINGTEFDSSYSRGMPATFPVNGVIKGWQEALVLMKPGAKWQLFIPPDLGLRRCAAQPKIPPQFAADFRGERDQRRSRRCAAQRRPPGTPHATEVIPLTDQLERIGEIAHRRRAMRGRAGVALGDPRQYFADRSGA